MAEGIDLKPFFALMTNETVLKVFHAAKQDIEILMYLSGTCPARFLIPRLPPWSVASATR